MAEGMTKTKLLEQVAAERQAFQRLLGTLSESQMTEPGVQGVWSIKDIVAHLAAWEERMIAWLGEAARGGAPALPDWGLIDQMNEQTYQERKDWSLAETLACWDALAAQVLVAVQSLPEADLLTPGRFASLGDAPLLHLVGANTFWHYPEHARAIRIWLDSQSADPLVYYACAGPMTDPRRYVSRFDALPDTVPALVEAVQGLLLHVFWAERYGVRLSEQRKQEVQLRSVSAMMPRLLELDPRPLTLARPLDKKLVGNCRDFSVLLCAMLRHKGIPARARCGFGAYFLPDHYEDHWVGEYWNVDQARWVLVDAQLDAFQQRALNISFDPFDVPRDQFVVAGQAWQMCRSGEVDPDRFGIFDMHGLWFVRGNLIRDVLALNKVEILPWDGGLGFLTQDAPEEPALMDRLAALTLGGNQAFAETRGLFQTDARLHIPAGWERS